MRPPTASAAQIAAADRRRKAIELRRVGTTFEQIAADCGYANRSAAYRDVKRALADITRQPAIELLAEELDRLDAMLAGLWSLATTGDVQSVRAVLKVMDARAKYRGLYAPTKIEASGPDGAPLAFVDPVEARAAALAALAEVAAGQ